MSNMIPGNQKHLTLKDRLYIEQGLDQNLSFKEIAGYMYKDPSTISKEVKARRKHEPHFTERLSYNANIGDGANVTYYLTFAQKAHHSMW